MAYEVIIYNNDKNTNMEGGQYCKGARGAVILSAGIRQREGGLWESEEIELLPMVPAMEMKPPAAPATAPGLGQALGTVATRAVPELPGQSWKGQ